MSQKGYFDVHSLGRHVNAPHILKSIFGHLDFESLQNAEEVSDDWRSIIMESKTWTHLLSKNVQLILHCVNYSSSLPITSILIFR